MTDQSPGTPTDPNTLSAIECSLADAHKKLSKLYDIQRASRIQLLVLISALVIVMLIFGARIYGRVTHNFNEDQVQQQLLERLPILGQDVAKQLNPVAQQVVPVYAKQIKDRIAEIAPLLRDDADELLKELPHDIHKDIMGRLNASIEKVAASVQKDTQKKFPYLSDQRAHAVMEHFVDALDRESKTITQRADTLLADEMHKVHNIMTQIKVPPVDKKDQTQVQRELIHHLLMYLDSELMAEPAAN